MYTHKLLAARVILVVCAGFSRIVAAQNGPLAPPTPVTVWPDGYFEPDRPKNSSGHATTFLVTNNTTGSLSLTFDCWGEGGVTCSSVLPTSKTLGAGAQVTLNVTYSVGASGGRIFASASGGGNYDDGYRIVTTPPTLTLVIPAVTQAPSTALIHTRTPLVVATYSSTEPADALIDTTTLVVKLGSDTVTALTRRNKGLVEWEVDTTRQLAPGIAKDVYVRICHTNGGCSSVTRSLLLDNSGPPIVSFAGMPLEQSAGGSEVDAGFSVPSYVSLGAPRSTGLVYSTRQSYPRALVNVDIELTWPAGNPDQIKAVLVDGGVRLDSLVANAPTCQAATGRRCRVTLQGDFSGSTYPRAARKWLKVEVSITSGANVKMTTDSVEVVLVDRRSSPYGSGWFLSGVMRLDQAGSDMLLIGPTGAASVYRGSGSVYLSPPGDFSVLVWTGTQWELRFRDGAKLVFDSQGLETKAIDRHGNTTNLAYAAVDRINTITDPMLKNLAFTYDASLKLTTITDPGSRQSRVTINASNQLVYDSVASPPTNSSVGTFSYTAYGGNNTVVLATATDALGQATTYSYDARRRPKQTTLPAVLPETGNTAVSPVVSYRAQVLRGLDTLLSLDSVFGRATDPRGTWVRSTLNRWGSPVRTWDSLGTIMRAAYTIEGYLAWTEGKVADSSRVYSQYDGLGHRIRAYRLRTATDTVLVDSLVWDASHHVIKQFNPLRQATQISYNGSGDVIKTITPTGDTTHYQYFSNGQLDRMRAPGQTGWTIYTYEPTWKNVDKVTNAAGVVLAANFYDGFGRTTETQRKLTIRVVNELLSIMQWRRTRTWYTALNQVDSVRTERTHDCDSPCDTPPPWPDPGNTLYAQQVRHVYDRLGRDTLRLNSSGKGTRYAYDGLGRLRARRPFADSAAVVDSFRYDVAGNLRFHYTRRGFVLEHRYDSRSRDTLTIVPGVGNYRRTYGGPADQLTRSWIDSYVDPIGGVNPEVRWGYSQAGLVRADTAQGTRVTSYLYDRYQRDTSVTDPAGTRRLRYDAVRGVLDTVVTPFSETLKWTVDSWGRAVGPYVVDNGAEPDYSMVPSWDQVGKLVQVANTHTVNVGRWEVESDMPDLLLRPRWTEVQGSNGPTVTTEDTLGHDGWGRVTAVQYVKNGAQLAAETFTFDQDGNLSVGGETRTYDVTTTRLTARAGETYAYDRAGNLVTRTVGGTTWTYEYDALERLVRVLQNGAPVARYAYDVLGRRIVKRVYSGPNIGYLRMIYRGGQVTAETDSLGTTFTLAYSWGLGTDNLVAIRRLSDNSHWYVVQDALHSMRGLSKKDGTWVASWRYRVYGAVLDSAGSAPVAVRYRWTGREYDAETGFYYFRARYYDPATQRFVQEDPIGYGGGVNLYAYGDGNPTNGRDPSGLLKHEIHYPFVDPAFVPACADCSGGGGGPLLGGGDWDGDGLDDFQELVDAVWAAQLHGMTLTDYEIWKRLKDQGAAPPPAADPHEAPPLCSGNGLCFAALWGTQSPAEILAVIIKLKSGFRGCPIKVQGEQVGRVTLYIREQRGRGVVGRAEDHDALAKYTLTTSTPGSTSTAEYYGTARIFRQSGELLWGPGHVEGIADCQEGSGQFDSLLDS